jgi:hypothetical protein
MLNFALTEFSEIRTRLGHCHHGCGGKGSYRPGVARGSAESPRAEDEAMEVSMGTEANTTWIGALVGTVMMVLPLVRRTP